MEAWDKERGWAESMKIGCAGIITRFSGTLTGKSLGQSHPNQPVYVQRARARNRHEKFEKSGPDMCG